MRTSYGVVWREDEQPLARGKLEFLATAVRLDGMAGSEPTTREIQYGDLAEIRIGRSAEERIDGKASLLLGSRTGRTIAIASVAQAGVLVEIAERLAALHLGSEGVRRLAVVLPLRENGQDGARTLLAAGPPFDPEALGLDRHEVFLTESEAVFVFESTSGAAVLEPLLEDPALWQSAGQWHALLAGPPRIAEDAYSWARRDDRVDEAVLPPGLHNGRSHEL